MERKIQSSQCFLRNAHELEQASSHTGRAATESFIKDCNSEGEGRDHQATLSFGQDPEKSSSGQGQEGAGLDPRSMQVQPRQSESTNSRKICMTGSPGNQEQEDILRRDI